MTKGDLALLALYLIAATLIVAVFLGYRENRRRSVEDRSEYSENWTDD